MKFIRHVVFTILLMSSLSAYSNPLVVGVLKFAPPFSSIDSDNHYFGFSIDLMNEICTRIHETCAYKATDLSTQFKDLDSGAIDITFLPSPLPSTDAGNYIFSLPYITSNGQFMSLKSSNINSIDDIKNKKIGALQATFIQTNVLPNFTSEKNIKAYSKITDLIEALNSSDIDAALVNENVAKYFLNNTLQGFKLVGQPIALGNGYGIIALKKNSSVINKINKALLQIEADGTYLSIYNRYFGN